MTADENRAYMATKQREYRARHADDPEYRARKQAANQRYIKKYAAELSERNKAKYALNPEPAKRRAKKRAEKHPEKVKAYRDANRDKRNAQSKAWKVENRERNLVTVAEWRLNHKDDVKVYMKKRYDANAETMREKSRKWREANPEKLFEQGRRYRQANPDKLHAKQAARRALKKGATVEKVDRGEIYLKDNGICGICKTRVPLHEVTLDHIIPLVKGGEHSKRNIQLAHRSCNSAKGSKLQARAYRRR